MLNELHEETIEIEIDRSAERPVATPVDVMGARAMMIRRAQIEREIEKTIETKRAVVDSYDGQIERLAEDKRFIDEALTAYVAAAGENLKFPDVGTAYLATDKPKMLVDRDQIPDEMKVLFEKSSFDEAAYRAHALDTFLGTGEILPGCEVVEESKSLRVRKAG